VFLATLLAALTITVWPEGMDGPHRTWTLRCSPVGGTLPRRVDACARLARLQSPFAPTPKNIACTEIYGGPQVAIVRGTYRGRRIWVRFARRDGCEIERWNRHKFLLPGGVGSVR
jgi:hypothetical protein